MKAWGIYIPADVDRPTERPGCWMRTICLHDRGVVWAMVFRSREEAEQVLEHGRRLYAGQFDDAEVREFDWALTPA